VTAAKGGEVLIPASAEDRLARIAETHSKQIDAHGGTWGDCNECGWTWPCPTYRWATAADGTVSILCTWDLTECEFDHDHEPEVSS
jgi:hypothetical protein